MKKKRCNSWHGGFRCEGDQNHKGDHCNRPSPDNAITWPRRGAKKNTVVSREQAFRNKVVFEHMELAHVVRNLKITVESLTLEVSAFRAERESMVGRIEKLEKFSALGDMEENRVRVNQLYDDDAEIRQRIQKLEQLPNVTKIHDEIWLRIAEMEKRLGEVSNECGDTLLDGQGRCSCTRPLGHPYNHSNKSAGVAWTQSGKLMTPDPKPSEPKIERYEISNSGSADLMIRTSDTFGEILLRAGHSTTLRTKGTIPPMYIAAILPPPPAPVETETEESYTDEQIDEGIREAGESFLKTMDDVITSPNTYGAVRRKSVVELVTDRNNEVVQELKKWVGYCSNVDWVSKAGFAPLLESSRRVLSLPPTPPK